MKKILFLLAVILLSGACAAQTPEQPERKYDLSFYGNARIISDKTEHYLDIVPDDGNPAAEILATREGTIRKVGREEKDGYGFVVEIVHEDGQLGKYRLLNHLSRNLETGNTIKKGVKK